MPIGDRRRAAGLRREELAGLAGISVDYLTRLEQGRATSPSSQVVEALARALRLSDAERELLFRLAGQAAPGRDVVSTRITPSVQRLLDRLSHTPVAVHDAAWNLIVANQPYDALMGETTSWHGIERNGVWRNLVGPGNRTVHTPEEQARFESLLVADLRMTAARYPADRELKRLIAELTSQQPALRRAVGVGPGRLAPGSVPAQDHRPSRRRTHHTRLRHPHRRRRRPADHGLHRRTRHRGRRTARTRRRPRHTGARRPGSEEVDRSMRKFAGKIGEKAREGRRSAACR